MHGSLAVSILEALALGVCVAGAFVVSTYLYALALTRGAFGWPGIRYFATETLWVCITQSLLPFGWFLGRALPARTGAERSRPIVLVHGFTQNRTNFVWLARALRRQGFGPFFGFNYDTIASPIEASAARLRDFVDGVLRQTGATEIDLVCHSLGGVVARTYVDLLDGHRRVRRVVTLGTPHRGLRQARPIFGRSIAQLNPRAGFIARLDAPNTESRAAFHSVYSVHDNIVFPGLVSSLGPRGEDFVVKSRGHFGILFSRDIADYVRGALAAEDRTLPPPTADTPIGTPVTTAPASSTP